MEAATDETVAERPAEGSRCLAGPSGRWDPATIRRVNEDGTYIIEFDVKEMALMKYWFGLPPAEISFNDPQLWPDLFAKLTAGRGTFGQTDLAELLPKLGYRVDARAVARFWTDSCVELFGQRPRAPLVCNSMPPGPTPYVGV